MTATPTPSSVSPRSARSSGLGSFASRSSTASGTLSQSRFLPGTLLAGRYRVIALLGRGGMGEVYRADDLTLDQAVAIKFLPESTARDETSLERFHNEVRIARRISHPNVCRIYDIGETDGLPFITMEYVDGEDLGSLLHRIGRLPHDKALEISRKLCAGLAAAHDKGVLHRDLKPANIMLNGEGEVVIMDFGLADVAERITSDQIRFGTPAYMAPEQLAGQEVSTRSDIYSLGLVLYEIFTGKRAFHADTLGEIVRLRSHSATPANPSTFVRDLDPGVERVILRCLEADPAARPASALAVSAALPGGDPLAAALAAGETPSPQMVAAAGHAEALSPKIAIPCLAAFVVALVISYVLGVKISGFDALPDDISPEVLRHTAQGILASAGYTAPAADAEYGFDEDGDYERYVQRADKPHPDWKKVIAGRPPVLKFWYRTSPQPLVATNFKDQSLVPGLVTRSDPPPILSGMIQLELDTSGRLISFEAIPPQLEENGGTAKPVDWSPLFAAAALDPSQLKSAEPIWNSLSSSDTRVAWTGTWPESSRPLRVEAAALRGKPVYFALLGPWTQPTRLRPNQHTAGQRASSLLLVIAAIVILGLAGWLAIRNHRKERGDAQGAFRLATCIVILQLLLWILRAHMVASVGLFGLFVLALSTSLFVAGLGAVLYMAIEPYIRRRWPQSLISWSRLLLGRWRDPLVGRDVLYGLLLGALWILIFYSYALLQMHWGASPQFGSSEFLLGARRVLGAWLLLVPNDIQGTLSFLFLIFIFRLVLRKSWLAGAAFAVFFDLVQTLGREHFLVSFIAWGIIYSLAAIAVVRFGLISLAAALFITDLLLNLPMTFDFSRWFAGATIFTYASVLAIGIWAFYTALAGQKLLKEELFE